MLWESTEVHRKKGAAMLYSEEISESTSPETLKGGGKREWDGGGCDGGGKTEDVVAATEEREENDVRALHGCESMGAVTEQTGGGNIGVSSVVDMVAGTAALAFR